MRPTHILPYWPSAAFAAVCFLLPGFARNAWGQQFPTMNPNYGTYTSYTTDGTYIYTSVTVDGNTQGTCPTFPAYLANECHSTTHTPEVYNMIGTVGGWENGGPTYWTNYLSMTNNQQIAATPGTEYAFSATGKVNCSFSRGAIYQMIINMWFKQVETAVRLVQDWGNGDCEVEPDCIAGQTPTCPLAYVTQIPPPCKSSYNCISLAYRSSLSQPYSCFDPEECSGPSTLPGPCD